MRNLCCLFCITLFIQLSLPAQAATMLSFSSTPANLDGLAIGQDLQIKVELTGLLAGEELDSLATTITYDNNLLGAPVITSGEIIPNPLDDPLDLVTATGVSVADVAFLTFGIDSPDHIVTNGVFFTLELQVIGSGSGAIAFDFAGATLFNVNNPTDPIEASVDQGPSLQLTAVPEPATLSLLLLASTFAGIRRLKNRSR